MAWDILQCAWKFSFFVFLKAKFDHAHIEKEEAIKYQANTDERGFIKCELKGYASSLPF